MVEQMVVRAVSEASRLGNLRVYMNPKDEENLVSLWQDSEINVSGQKIQLVPSENIERGGCFVEGEFGSVDSRIGIQLETIQSQINQLLINREDLI
jgi:flagellar biosynthesis/type III secretory pathway protein FliH